MSAEVEYPLDRFVVGGKPLVPKNRKKNADRGSARPIDEIEQEKIISELKEDAERLASKGRATFYYLFLVISGIFILCLTYSVAFPFGMEHQVSSVV